MPQEFPTTPTQVRMYICIDENVLQGEDTRTLNPIPSLLLTPLQEDLAVIGTFLTTSFVHDRYHDKQLIVPDHTLAFSDLDLV